MALELDAAWTDEAIARYERIEASQVKYQRAVRELEVTVRSADGTVEIVITADGQFRSVALAGASPQLNAALLDTMRSATEASTWARQKIRAEEFGAHPSLDNR